MTFAIGTVLSQLIAFVVFVFVYFDLLCINFLRYSVDHEFFARLMCLIKKRLHFEVNNKVLPSLSRFCTITFNLASKSLF